VNVFAIRHGETAWSLSGQHTSTTDIPLTENGRRLAQRMRPVLATNAFELVLCSPMQRARETCELAGLGDKAIIDSDLVEWNYGEYEGLTPQQVDEVAPDWLIFRDGCPGGEAPEQVGARMDRVIARLRAISGDTALFAHGHVLRVLVARWIGLHAGGGQHFLLDTGTLCVLVTTARYRTCGSGTGLSSARARRRSADEQINPLLQVPKARTVRLRFDPVLWHQ
jgi:broad specificity phosphatase PhoE